jgi:hypothetical protein
LTVALIPKFVVAGLEATELDRPGLVEGTCQLTAVGLDTVAPAELRQDPLDVGC